VYTVTCAIVIMSTVLHLQPYQLDIPVTWACRPVSVAADVFRISKRVLSTWTTQGLIASIKGEGANSHRLVHIDNILAHMERQLRIAKEASLRVSEDESDIDLVCAEDDDTDAVDDLMQDASPHASSPIIAP
jgi:hypothetical protein